MDETAGPGEHEARRGPSVRFMVRLRPMLLDELQAAAEAAQMSASDLARYFLRSGLDDWKARG